MDTFLSCDWGTSAFRLRLVKAGSFAIAAEEVSSQGIAPTHEKWSAAGSDENTRTAFYLQVVDQHILRLETKLKYSLTGIPVILSGMASSSIGMLPLSYGKLPLGKEGPGLIYRYLKRTNDFEHDVLMISGLQSSDDVMRGEETQLIGCMNENDERRKLLYIFPGTHSKHIEVYNGEIIDFKTFMTGELFDLLASKSILNNSITGPGSIDEPGNLKSFRDGIMKARKRTLLNSLFSVRAGYLLDQRSKEENYFYLSGLLIGDELSGLRQNSYDEVILCSSGSLKSYYEQAAKISGINNFSIAEVSLEQAVIRGQYFIYNNICKNERVFVG